VTTTEQAARLGALTEALHAVVYFAPEPAAAYAELGLRGYWRGYFASRAAALGRPSAELVTALFAGFAPSFVARAVPEVWSLAPPEAVVVARRQGAVAALRRLLGDTDVSAAAERTGMAVTQLDLPGRPLAAAQAALPRPREPLAALWHDCTVLREHRGDGHLAAVTAAGLRWPEPHLLAAHRNDPRQQELRGWSDERWQAAQRRIAALGPEGIHLHDQVERTTDELAVTAYEQTDAAELIALLEPLASAVVTGGGLPFPNAMGLVSPARPAPPAASPGRGTPAAGA
jgi:hypothetical protein